jgi:hypothetical protein
VSTERHDDDEEDAREGREDEPRASTPPSRPSRPSRPSSAPRPSRPSRPARPPRARRGSVARVVFAAAWIALQGALVLTAGRRPDGAFGFRMFSESSTLRLTLTRELANGARVPAPNGAWQARGPGGLLRAFDWHDRVKRPEMGVFDREISASYGAAAQLSRLRAALDDVASHVPDDTETRRLVLDVTIRRNGREPYTVELTSPVRRLPPRPAGGS